MQIEIYNPAQGEPLPPVKWNYEELKAELIKALENYKGLVYTEATVTQAKKDRASLNKLAEAIDARRKEMKARYLAPYKEFEAQAKELTALVKKQASEIDAQIKTFDEARKAEKLEHIKSRYAEIMDNLVELVPYDKIHNPKWLNVAYSMGTIDMEIAERAEKVRSALVSIDALGLSPDMTEQIKRVYLDRLDLAAALAEKDRIERERQALADYEAAKKAAEASKRILDTSDPEAFAKAKPGDVVRFGGPGCVSADPQNEAPRLHVVDFRVWATAEQLGSLKAFLYDNGIKYGPCPQK